MNIIKKILGTAVIGGVLLSYNAQAENPICSETLPEITDPNFGMQLYEKVRDCDNGLESRISSNNAYQVSFLNNGVRYYLLSNRMGDNNPEGMFIYFNRGTINSFLPPEGIVYVSLTKSWLPDVLRDPSDIGKSCILIGLLDGDGNSYEKLGREHTEDGIVCHDVLNGVRDVYNSLE